MKNGFLLLLLLIPALRAFAQTGSGYLIDSSYCEIYDANDATWPRSYYSHYKYDAENRFVGLESIYWNQPSNTVSYIYNGVLEYNDIDSVSSLTTQFGYGPGDPVLENADRFEYFYDGTLWTQAFYYYWDDVVGDWNIYHRSNYTYDAAGNRTVELYENYNETTGTWETSTIRTYTYSAGGKLILSTEQDFNDGIPGDSNYTDFFYMGDLLDSEVHYITIGDVTYTQSKTTYTYTSDNAHIASITFQSNISGSLQNSWRELNTYDSNGDKIQYTSQKWDDDISAWYDDRVTDYEYDDHHNQVYSISKKRDSGSGTLVNERRCYNYFSVDLLPVVEVNNGNGNCLFSNPVSDVLTLNCTAFSDQTGLSIWIIDMTGRVVIHAPFQSGASISMEGVTPGLYFFQVLQKQEVLASGKVVRQ